MPRLWEQSDLLAFPDPAGSKWEEEEEELSKTAAAASVGMRTATAAGIVHSVSKVPLPCLNL